ncbi:MAG TPA: hypothetical protein PKW78_05925 [Bacteroidales bacterium]|nr:hypothetical protein [Bacteroidales bacterium]
MMSVQIYYIIQAGEIKPIKQSEIHPLGFYCGIRSDGDEIINWNNSSREIFNFIRAILEPGPKAITFKENTLVKINKTKMIENAPTL